MRLKYAVAGVVAVIFAAGVPVFAQVTAGEKTQTRNKAARVNKDRTPKAPGIVDVFAQQLGLSEDQKSKVSTTVMNYRTGVKQIMLNSTYKPEEKQTKVEELRTKADLEIRTVLTPEQSEKAKSENLTQKLLVVGPVNANADELATYLKLTPEQKQQMSTIFTDTRTRQKQIMSDTKLTDDAKKEQLKALRLESDKKIQALLNDEQKAKYQQLKPAPRKTKAEGNKAGNGINKGQGKKKNAPEAEQPAAAQ